MKNALDNKQNIIDSSNKLNADLVDDTNSINKFVTNNDISNWNSKQDEIDSSNKLNADLVDDTNSANKFVTSTDISNWNSKQDELISGTNIKTINNASILGSGNVDISSQEIYSDNEIRIGTWVDRKTII